MTVLWRVRRPLAVLGALAMTISTGLGAFHFGVAKKWWDGPRTCSGAAPADLSTEALLDQVLNAPIVRCDEAVWDLWGITMAGWNAVISLGLALLWIFAALPRTPTRHLAPQ